MLEGLEVVVPEKLAEELDVSAGLAEEVDVTEGLADAVGELLEDCDALGEVDGVTLADGVALGTTRPYLSAQ